MKVGDPIWRFDENRRRYTEPKEAGGFGEIIWREHWERLVVIGQTRTSWIVGHKTWECARVPKKALARGDLARSWARSEQEVDDLVWVHENAYWLGVHVQRTTDRDKLAKVAEIVGYVERGARG